MSIHYTLPNDIRNRIESDVDDDGYVGTDDEPLVATRFAPLDGIVYNATLRCIEIIGDDELENVVIRIPLELLNRRGFTDQQIADFLAGRGGAT